MNRAIACLVLLAQAAGASAAGVPWLQRAAPAPFRLVGRCDARTSRWEGGSIFSYCELSVLRTVSGDPGTTIVVRQRGGEIDGIGQRVSHLSLLEPGQNYLLFLAPDESGAWSPISNGVNPIEETIELGEAVGGEPLEEVLRLLGSAN